MRGKTPSANKTSEARVYGVCKHIEAFQLLNLTIQGKGQRDNI